MENFRETVKLEEAVRLVNHGPTVFVSAAHGGRKNVMTAAWVMPLDVNPPKVLAVINAGAFTRELMEKSGEFALSVPSRVLADKLMGAGSSSGRDGDKFEKLGLTDFAAEKISAPLVEGCVGWLECRLIRNAGNEAEHDLFMAEVVAAQADSRVFSNGQWKFETAPDDLRTLHYITDGKFYAAGNAVTGKA